MEKQLQTRLDEALSKLGEAVDALETAGAECLDALSAGADTADVVRMSEELAAIRSDYEALQLTSQRASERIDDAIGKLKAVLEA